jgi:hypothetical protein
VIKVSNLNLMLYVRLLCLYALLELVRLLRLNTDFIVVATWVKVF